MTPGLGRFFDAVGPYLQGKTTFDALAEALGPLPKDLAYYRWLVAFDQRRILAELYGPAKAWLDAAGHAFDALADKFMADHPPAGHSVAHVGAAFPGWLEQQPGLPDGVASVADFLWTKLEARNAPDVAGLGMDSRVHFRQYPVNPMAALRALPGEVPPSGPSAWIIYRKADDVTVHTLPATLATLAVLLPLAAPGSPLFPLLGASPLPPALSAVPAEQTQAETARLQRAGVLPG